MRLEIESAANFLSDLLRLHALCLTPQQLESFRLTIIEHLAQHYREHWFPEKPFKGSGYRCLRINHKMDPMLSRAGRLCGLSESALRTLFPNELTLWIDPNEVSYRIGENGSICVIFDAINYDPLQPSPQQFLTKTHHNYSHNNNNARLTPSPLLLTDSQSQSSSSSLSTSLSSNSSSASSSPSSSPQQWYHNSNQFVDRQSPPTSGHHLVSSAANKSFYLNSLLS